MRPARRTVAAMPPALSARARRWPLVRAISWHRRLVAAAAAAAAVAFMLEAAEPAGPPTSTAVVASRDLAAGAVIGDDHVRRAAIDLSALPDGALGMADVVGRTLAGPVRAGEVLTDARLLSPSLMAGYDTGLVGAPVRLADPGVARLLRTGDRVDVIAAGGETLIDAPATGLVVAGAQVVVVPETRDDAVLDSGALVVLATTPGQAEQLAAAAVTSRLTVSILPVREPVGGRRSGDMDGSEPPGACCGAHRRRSG